MSDIEINAVCKVLCRSGKFETGQGTCALICMSQLGDARHDCSYREQVFSKIAKDILKALGHKI